MALLPDPNQRPRIRTYKLKEDRLGLKAGTLVRKYMGYDYGCSSDDERMTGEKHISVTEDIEEGDGPFVTCPTRILEIFTE